ncbi:MAG TPA: SET domain-containing protein-lysine N-methyltransferase [Gemmatimonadaceae bacterium]
MSRYFEIRASSIQGRGAFALRRIRKGTRLIEYTGEHISHDVADERYDDDAMGRHHTFLFTLDDDTVVDAAVGGNESRFINHSCDPNCQAVIEDERIFIESIRTIQPGEELVYDYQYERAEDADESDEARYPCHCGAPNCRGTILAPPKKAGRGARGAGRERSVKRKSESGKRKKVVGKTKGGGRKTVARAKRGARRKRVGR